MGSGGYGLGLLSGMTDLGWVEPGAGCGTEEVGQRPSSASREQRSVIRCFDDELGSGRWRVHGSTIAIGSPGIGPDLVPDPKKSEIPRPSAEPLDLAACQSTSRF